MLPRLISVGMWTTSLHNFTAAEYCVMYDNGEWVFQCWTWFRWLYASCHLQKTLMVGPYCMPAFSRILLYFWNGDIVLYSGISFRKHSCVILEVMGRTQILLFHFITLIVWKCYELQSCVDHSSSITVICFFYIFIITQVLHKRYISKIQKAIWLELLIIK